MAYSRPSVHRIQVAAPASLLRWRRPRYSPPRIMGEPIYKICTEAALQEARCKGRFKGSADDLRDGFIHLSAGPQVAGTLAIHFAGRDDLLLLAVDAERLGPNLKWEPSRGGELFPHPYGPLDLGLVLWTEPTPLGEDGRHRLPAGVAP